MGASSHEGTGQGMSNGKKKPGNGCGCCGCGSHTDTPPKAPYKRGCVINGKTSSRVVNYSTKGGIGIQVC